MYRHTQYAELKWKNEIKMKGILCAHNSGKMRSETLLLHLSSFHITFTFFLPSFTGYIFLKRYWRTVFFAEFILVVASCTVQESWISYFRFSILILPAEWMQLPQARLRNQLSRGHAIFPLSLWRRAQGYWYLTCQSSSTRLVYHSSDQSLSIQWYPSEVSVILRSLSPAKSRQNRYYCTRTVQVDCTAAL